jgi:predicted amidohydrolase YtcJ
MRFLYNAQIYTQDPQNPLTDALAIRDGRILATGLEAHQMAERAKKIKKYDLNGQTVWPGLTDAHLHLEFYATGLNKIDCETNTLSECLRRVAERNAADPGTGWILGHGWNQNLWSEGFGDAAMLDRAAPDRPVFLTAKSLHAAWANTAALQLAGITSTSPDPEGGKIERDDQGHPTGILLENAMDLVFKVLPEPSIHQLSQMFEKAQSELWKVGLTGIHDFDRGRCFAALQLLQSEDKLRLRVLKNIPQEHLPHAAALGLRSGFGNEFIKIGGVKLFADGALGPRTAAMLQPYAGETDYCGMPLLDQEMIFELGQQAAKAGLPLTIHAIGDRANHEVIEAYTQLRAFEQHKHLPHLRHRIEHVQVLHPDDLPRLAQLQVIASMQPIHATSDMEIADRHWGQRAAFSYAWRSLKEQHTVLAFGSDAPVENPNPFWGLHAAVTRRRQDGSPADEGWYPQQRLSLDQALEAYTLGPAFAAGREHELGKLQPGFLADLIVLKEDPFKLPSQELFNIRPTATMVHGDWVWQS